MKTKILKKVNQRVRIVKNATGGYDIESRDPSDKKCSNWHTMNTFSQHKKAVEKKNGYIVMVVMRDIGYRNVFVKRRTKRKEVRRKTKK